MRAYHAVILVVSMQVAISSYAAEVIFTDKVGRTITTEDLKDASGKFNWEIRSDKPVPEEAKRLHQLGRDAGQRGDSKTAIKSFEDASKLAPDWPYPLYDTAYTYLLMGDSSRAFELYKRVDDMSPRGFFTTKTAVHSLRGELGGAFPKGTYLYFLSTEWTTDTSKQLNIADQLLAKAPKFAPAWKVKALLESDDGKRLGYLENGLQASPDTETKGFLLINKAILLHRQGKKTEAVRILGELALDQTSPLDIEAIARKSLAILAKK